MSLFVYVEDVLNVLDILLGINGNTLLNNNLKEDLLRNKEIFYLNLTIIFIKINSLFNNCFLFII
jgi:hypothetical protein